MLELLGDGILVISRSLGLSVSILELWHGDSILIGVLERLIICHVLGQWIASLIGVDLGVVQAQVVLVSIVPALFNSQRLANVIHGEGVSGSHAYLLLVGAHLSPATLTLFLNGTLGGLGTKVIGNDGPSMLHVQEVRG